MFAVFRASRPERISARQWFPIAKRPDFGPFVFFLIPFANDTDFGIINPWDLTNNEAERNQAKTNFKLLAAMFDGECRNTVSVIAIPIPSLRSTNPIVPE